MIELIVSSRCDDCRACVSVCPTNVFEVSADGTHAPRIARAADCQTCFLCELYCPQDAIYVDPHVDRVQGLSEAEVIASGTLGEYRRFSGWGEDREQHPNLFWRQGELFARGAKAAR